jgi:hypothetical protein
MILSTSAAALPRADLVYVRSHFAAFGLAFLARLLGKPVIHEVNGVYDDAFITHPRFRRVQGLLGWMQRQQYRWSSALIALTPNLVAWAQA